MKTKSDISAGHISETSFYGMPGDHILIKNAISRRDIAVYIGFIVVVVVSFILSLNSTGSDSMFPSSTTNLSPICDYYTDSTSSLTIYDVSDPEFKSKFISNKNYYLSPGHKQVSTWIRFKLPPSFIDSVNWGDIIISVDYSYISDFQVYTTPHAHYDVYEQSRSHFFDVSKNKTKSFISPWSKIDIDADLNKYIYIKIDSDYPSYSIYAQSSDDFYRQQNWLLTYYAGNAGLLFSVLIANIIMTFLFRSKAFLIHSGFLICILLYIASYSGSFGVYFKGHELYSNIWAIIAIIVFLYFARHSVSQYTQLMKLRVFSTSLFVFTLIFLSFLIIVNDFSFYQAGNAGCIIAALYGISTTLYIHIKHEHMPIFYLIGVLSLSVGTLISSLLDSGVLHSRYWMWGFLGSISLEALMFSIGIYSMVNMIEKKNVSLYNTYIHDPLTKLFNRYYLDSNIDKFFSRIENENIRLSFVLADIDRFKNINDKFGHDVGDIVLKEMADIIRSSVRNTDIVVRWGGEEISIILVGAGLSDAVHLAENVRKKISEYKFSVAGNVTCSFGVTEAFASDTYETAFKRTDIGLYKAKNSGRNCVVAYEGVYPKSL